MRPSLWATVAMIPGLAGPAVAHAADGAAVTAPWHYEVNVRARYLGVPKGLMDTWFHGAKDEGWPVAGADRPKIQGASYGAEFVFERNHSLGLFYVEFAQSLMGEGYWDDREDGLVSFHDGSWIRPSKLFGAVTFGLNGAYDAELVTLSQTDGKFGLALEVGGGLGLSTVVGQLDKWQPDPSTGEPAYQLVANGMAPNQQMIRARVWPAVDLNLGFKLNFADKAVLRLEAGIHDAFYVGGALGARFGGASRPRSP